MKSHEYWTTFTSRTLAIIAVVIVLGIYALLHYAVHEYLRLFGINILPIIVTLGIISIISLFLVRIDVMITKVIYIIGMVWMGIVFIAAMYFGVLLLLYRLGLPHSLWWLLPLLLILLYGLYNAFFPKVKHVRITIEKKFKPIKLVQLSDVHVGEVHGDRFLAKIVRKINAIRPDAVVITGDLFDGTTLRDTMIDELQHIKAPVLFCSGNHEEYAGMHKALAIVKKTKIRIIDDDIVRIGDVQIVGLGYRSSPGVLKKIVIDEKKPTILLRHLPIPTKGFDLQLSGHTHHGQLWPISYLVLLQFPVRSGLHQDGTMYVSQGTGTWGPPFRLGSRGEITVLEISGEH